MRPSLRRADHPDFIPPHVHWHLCALLSTLRSDPSRPNVVTVSGSLPSTHRESRFLLWAYKVFNNCIKHPNPASHPQVMLSLYNVKSPRSPASHARGWNRARWRRIDKIVSGRIVQLLLFSVRAPPPPAGIVPPPARRHHSHAATPTPPTPRPTAPTPRPYPPLYYTCPPGAAAAATGCRRTRPPPHQPSSAPGSCRPGRPLARVAAPYPAPYLLLRAVEVFRQRPAAVVASCGSSRRR